MCFSLEAVIRRGVELLLRAYQIAISPFLPQACRFQPSCSEYARQAVIKHGTFRGLLMAAWRLSKCQPFHAGGFDPVQ